MMTQIRCSITQDREEESNCTLVYSTGVHTAINTHSRSDGIAYNSTYMRIVKKTMVSLHPEGQGNRVTL